MLSRALYARFDLEKPAGEGKGDRKIYANIMIYIHIFGRVVSLQGFNTHVNLHICIYYIYMHIYIVCTHTLYSKYILYVLSRICIHVYIYMICISRYHQHFSRCKLVVKFFYPAPWAGSHLRLNVR